MQWVEHTEANTFYSWTLEGTEQIASLTFTPGSKSFRLLYTSQRWFFLEYSGVLQQKIVVKSEYGITVGEIQPQRYGQNGTITVNGLKYYYTESYAAIDVLDKNKNLIVNLELKNMHKLDSFELCALLFAYAWVFPAISAENVYLTNVSEQM
ncbi:MAG TPA: hypothetical protein VD794_00150 [Flavisolibacter sp.]|nr:hypothetical protein [Flavisolibacter sp.]